MTLKTCGHESGTETKLLKHDQLGHIGSARKLDPNALGDHTDRLYRAAWGLCGSHEEAEDLVQETFARVLRKSRILCSENDIGYLLRVLRNAFVSSRRTSAARPLSAPLLDTVDHDRTAAGPDALVEMIELHEVIAGLPDDFREVLVAIDVVGLSYREAARTLRVKEATITTRLHRARQRVADKLEPDP